jgi:integrase
LKRATLKRVFAFAAASYDNVINPFDGGAAWAVADAAAADQRDAFTPEELKTLLNARLPGHLFWLTWLGLCTGARLNELCQLTSDHVRAKDPMHIYFGPDLRLKTERRSGSSIRSVPLHMKLVSLGFLECLMQR